MHPNCSGVWVHLFFHYFLQKEKTFVNFFFASMDDVSLSKRGLLLKERILLKREATMNMPELEELLALKVYTFTFETPPRTQIFNIRRIYILYKNVNDISQRT